MTKVVKMPALYKVTAHTEYIFDKEQLDWWLNNLKRGVPENKVSELKRKGITSYATEMAPLNRGLTTWKICLTKNTRKKDVNYG